MSKVVYYKENQDFNNDILNDSYVLVDFFATWCGPCQQLGPELDKLSEEVDYKVVKIDIDEARELAIQNGVRSVPTLVLFKGKEEVGRIIGYRDKDELKEEVRGFM